MRAHHEAPGGKAKDRPEFTRRLQPWTDSGGVQRGLDRFAYAASRLASRMTTCPLCPSTRTRWPSFSRVVASATPALCQSIPATEVAMARNAAMVSWSLSSNSGSVLVLTITTSRTGST